VTAVGDGHPVGVTRQIGEHGLGTRERWYGIDDPVDLQERGQIGDEGAAIGEFGELAKEL
jgi:hypothetical protein